MKFALFLLFPVLVILYGYEVVRIFPHSRDGYTQGLEFSNGVLWEGTGLYGRSKLQKLDLKTGTPTVIATLPRTEFGEGITILDGRIYQLTWYEGKCHVYEEKTGKLLKDFTYTGEGWGLCNDGTHLYMSDGTSAIRVLDPATFRPIRTIETKIPYLNELEWVDGKIWANVYTTEQILMINPKDGDVEGIVDLAGLLPSSLKTPSTDVLNGIAITPEGKIYVTGKNWPKIYQIKLKQS